MTSQRDEYSLINRKTITIQGDIQKKASKRDYLNEIKKTDSQKDVYSSRLKYLTRFTSEKNVVVYNGQTGDKFQMRHNLNSGQGLSMFTDELNSGNLINRFSRVGIKIMQL